MALVTLDVCGRKFLGMPVWGTFELSCMMMGALVTFGFTYTHMQESNISVTLVFSRFSSKYQQWANFIYSLIGTCATGVIVWQTILYIIGNAKRGSLLGVLDIPVWPFQIPFLIGYAIFCFVLASECVMLIHKLRKKSE
jgi:TRAP-type C4-dicarboxylate transport system permease small subunit